MIRIQGLHKFFNKGRGNEIHVINDVSLDLPERGMVALFGKSGCGKTTLLNVIGGLDKYAEGTLTIEGQSIRRNTDVIRNQYIGYIFQNYNLNKSETCFDNIADALRLCGMTDSAEIESRVMAALANVGMEKYSKRTPDTLSGGQQQRIAIARAIVKNPRIILADEPTGNLDEENTVMIMDLLKAISRDHLVLLVTHEANLVDYYCDTVIELSDGKVLGIKNNESANGFVARGKNDIYLGELAKTELCDKNTQIEYYGDAPTTPVRLKIVNNGGKLYVQIGTERVQIIDEFSEVKLREGVYEERVVEKEQRGSIDMSRLPPVKGTRFGRLFSFGSSVKSGYRANFKNNKKGKRVLRGCMGMFSAIIVFMSALFGTAFGDIISARDSYNHNVFYLYTPDNEISEKLSAGVNSASTGIDYIRLSGEYPGGDRWIYFRTGTFETFKQYDFEGNFKTNAVYLDTSLAKNLRLVEGKRDGLDIEEILITTKVADSLLEKSTLGYITERKDLIGLVSSAFMIDGKSPRIAGIVESDESAIYLTELAMARYVRETVSPSFTSLASDYGISVSSGEATLVMREYIKDTPCPQIGETIKIQGLDFKITDIKIAYYDYYSWLQAEGIKKLDEATYFTEALKKQSPSLVEGTEEFNKAYGEICDKMYYDYCNYYYSEVGGFLKDYYLFEPNNLELWLYNEKEIEEAKYLFLPEDYFKAVKYKELYGEFPSYNKLQEVYSNFQAPYDHIKSYYSAYEEEFYNSNHWNNYINTTYMVSDEDYIALSKRLGETHDSAKQNTEQSEEIYEDMYYYGNYCYTVIHSSNPELTDAWLRSEFSGITPPYEDFPVMLTPSDAFDNAIAEGLEEIIASIVTLVIMLVLMSVCMYFIMRSSLMNRIKEIGVYRVVGVSKGNLIFKFFVEAVVLTTLTVFVGYLITSGFLSLCLGASTLVADIFYYPLWLAGAVLVVLYALSLFFGILPISTLLRKTPSEILAKYDI